MEGKNKLYGGLYNPRVNKILITASFAGVKLDRHMTDYQYMKSPEYLAKHPLGKVPMLETPQGCIFESAAICRFLAHSNASAKLFGENAFEAGLVEQWIDFATTEIDPQLIPLIYPIFGWRPTTEELRTKAHEDLTKLLKVLDEHVKKTGFMVGTHITLADIALVSSLLEIFRLCLSEAVRGSLPNLTKWFHTISEHEKVKEVVGKIHLPKSEWKPDSHWVHAAGHAHHHEEKKGGDKKEAHKDAGKKKEEKKEEPKKKEAKKEEEHGGDDEDKPEKKAKNPLDLLPASPFNLYDFKTLYVNAPNKHDALTFFWQNFDPAGYSLWIMQYQKAEGENTKLFLTSNMAGGITQRLDDFRKYSFGVHGVYGEEGNYEIKGCLVWRGTEHAQELKDLPNYEYHTFKRLDHANEAHRKLVEEYWTTFEEGKVVDGLKVCEAKYFK